MAAKRPSKRLARARFALQVKKIVAEMAAYSDDRLRELAASPPDREQMERVLKDCQAVMASARRCGVFKLKAQVDRISKALGEVTP